ncbi:cytochrome c oxidase assembly factor 1 family protein [Granulicella paludicola]|uniref:cytochrome c oxidase assembly factor 1 family protein n=1 Tax=Granulicella paludicola TaxID=474951 RepID=UPI0021E02736|nr:cytochrome c oxidase assembly factor 1 family protein [Granulicella paludicola]
MSHTTQPAPGDELEPPSGKRKPSLGCLGISLLVGFIALFGGCCAAGMIFLISAGMRHSDAYRLAMQDAELSPCVVQSLGLPLKAGWFINGGMRTTNAEGSADLDFSVSGPKNAGRMHVVATRLEGTWYLQVLNVRVGGERINILPEPSGCD